MQSILLGVSSLRSSRLAYGCWRVGGTWDQAKVTPESRAAGHRAIIAAYEAGYSLFDNADIYCGGEAERILGEVLKEVSGMRSRVLIATKCGIRPPGTPHPQSPQRYDFSKAHIVESCDGSLRRLNVETIDLYMLHRPDFLAAPEEIANAFSELKASGKVRYFGVSNFRPTLVTALQVACPMPLVVHQMEISLANLDALEDGTLDQCLIEKITPMAWSPLAAGLIGAGAHDLLPSQKVYRTEPFLPAIDAVAKERGASRTTVALAWLLKHPSGIQPIVGSVNPDRIRQAAKADELVLSREEWYNDFCSPRAVNHCRDPVGPPLHFADHFRLFIALSVPDEVKHHIERVQSDLRRLFQNPDARWTRREQFHLTLRFLSQVPVARVDELVAAARSTCEPFGALRLTASGIGCFPDAHSPRVLWTGIKEAENRLSSLWAALQSATLPFTQEPAEISFIGHITLARFNRLNRQLAGDLIRATAKYDNTVFGDWTAERVELMRSELLPQGARHTVLADLPLHKERPS